MRKVPTLPSTIPKRLLCTKKKKTNPWHVLVPNDFINSRKWSRKEGVVFKINMEKMYVEWRIVEKMLNRFGVGDRWKRWIWEYISSTSSSILVNGSPSCQFKVSWCVVVVGVGGGGWGLCVLGRGAFISFFFLFMIVFESFDCSHSKGSRTRAILKVLMLVEVGRYHSPLVCRYTILFIFTNWEEVAVSENS